MSGRRIALMTVGLVFAAFGVLGLGKTFLSPDASTSSEPRLESRPAAQSGFGERPNVVTIELESVGARAVGVYNEDARTTPYLDSLAEESLVAERAYTTIPHTGKALVSSNCGIYPPPHTLSSEAREDALGVPCMAELLAEQGYEKMHFGPAKIRAKPDGSGGPPDIAGGGAFRMRNFGFEKADIYPGKERPTEGLVVTPSISDSLRGQKLPPRPAVIRKPYFHRRRAPLVASAGCSGRSA